MCHLLLGAEDTPVSWSLGEEGVELNIEHPTSNIQEGAMRCPLGVGSWMLGVGCWELDVGRWMFLYQAVRVLPAREKSRSVSQGGARSEEHTSELQSHHDLVCRLLLEKKKKRRYNLT